MKLISPRGACAAHVAAMQTLLQYRQPVLAGDKTGTIHPHQRAALALVAASATATVVLGARALNAPL